MGDALAVGDLLCRSFAADRTLAGFFESVTEAAKSGKRPLDASWPNRPHERNARSNEMISANATDRRITQV